jgi:hypothetical protein
MIGTPADRACEGFRSILAYLDYGEDGYPSNPAQQFDLETLGKLAMEIDDKLDADPVLSPRAKDGWRHAAHLCAAWLGAAQVRAGTRKGELSDEEADVIAARFHRAVAELPPMVERTYQRQDVPDDLSSLDDAPAPGAGHLPKDFREEPDLGDPAGEVDLGEPPPPDLDDWERWKQQHGDE